MREQWAAEDEAVRRGDFDAAVEITLRMSGRRAAPAAVRRRPGVRAAVAEMQRRALELQAPYWEKGDEELLVPDIADRLGRGARADARRRGRGGLRRDARDRAQARGRDPRRAARDDPGAAHVPSLERPELFDPLVLGFLADTLS